jgi:hypothetical protein
VLDFEQADVISLQGMGQRPRPCRISDAKVWDSARMPVERAIRLFVTGALLATAFAVSGCSTQVADMPLLGVPADAPPRPKEAGTYLPVHDLPPSRDEAAMNLAEQKRIAAELAAARDRQASSSTPATSKTAPAR